MKQNNGLSFYFILHSTNIYTSPNTHTEVHINASTAPAFLIADAILWDLLGSTAGANPRCGADEVKAVVIDALCRRWLFVANDWGMVICDIIPSSEV